MTTAPTDIQGRTPLALISNRIDMYVPLQFHRRQDADPEVMTHHELGLHDLDGVDDDVAVEYYGPSIHRSIDEILVPVAGGPNTDAVLGLAGNLASSWDASVTLLTVLPEDPDSEREHAARRRLEDYAGEFDGIQVETCLEAGDDVVTIITGLTERFELVVIGDSEQSLFGRFFHSSIPDRLDRNTRAPIFVVSR